MCNETLIQFMLNKIMLSLSLEKYEDFFFQSFFFIKVYFEIVENFIYPFRAIIICSTKNHQQFYQKKYMYMPLVLK